MKKTLRAGVIGLGIGEKHVEAYQSHPSCLVSAVCDLSDEKLKKARERVPGVHVTKDAVEILKDPEVDLVSVASYDDAHHEQVMQALENGKHVFVEKPLCQKPWQALEIRKSLSERPHLKLSSNFGLRTCPRFIRLKESIRSGKMGRIFYMEADYFWGRIHKMTEGWRREMEQYSIIQGAAVHMIDLLLWITGMRPAEVMGAGSRIATMDGGSDFDDFASLIMRFPDGGLAKVSANGGCVHPHFHRVTAFGTKMSFLNEMTGAVWIDSRDPEAMPKPVTEEYPGKEKRSESITGFVNEILGVQPGAVTSTEEVFDTMSVCFAAESAVREGGAVPIEYI